ncbi:MAG: MBL fold metallo-hydrolase [Blautia sp.]|jgi:ribonuclease Z
MEQLIVLGTGNAAVTKCFNTCFLLQREEEYLLVDTGGGNGILAALEKAGVKITDIHEIFITHEHCDHLLGIVWMIRMIATAMKKGNYEGNCNIYCHSDLVPVIDTIARLTIQGKFYQMIGQRIFLVPLEDGDCKKIIGYDVTFFDIHSTKAKQYGFTLTLQNGKKLTCAGDEPYNEVNHDVVAGSDWLFHEAFCLASQADRFKPYEKHHSTVKDACELAQELGIPNLVLWHTEDKNLERRKELYMAEGEQYYHGNLYVPYDLEKILL